MLMLEIWHIWFSSNVHPSSANDSIYRSLVFGHLNQRVEPWSVPNSLRFIFLVHGGIELVIF